MDHVFHTLTKTIHFRGKIENVKATTQQTSNNQQRGYPTQLDIFSNKPIFDPVVTITNESSDQCGQHEVLKQSISNEDATRLRKKHNIRLTPTVLDDPSIPNPITSFFQLEQFSSSKSSSADQLIHALLVNMSIRGWNQPTPIQMQAIPIILAGRDLLAHSPTGSGKTISFLLPTLISLAPSAQLGRKPRALILEPTRELAQQVKQVAHGLIGTQTQKNWIVSVLGEDDHATRGHKPPSQKRKRKISHHDHTVVSEDIDNKTNGKSNVVSTLPITGCDVLISTPLKLLYHLKAWPESISEVNLIILDEADQLLDKTSFLEQVDQILDILQRQHAVTTSLSSESLQRKKKKRKHVQKVMMSATISSEVEEICKSVMSSARFVRLLIGQKHAAPSIVKQRLDYVDSEASKLSHFMTLLRNNSNSNITVSNKVEKLCPPVLIFCQSAERVEELCKILRQELTTDALVRIPARSIDYIHGSRPKEDRDRVVREFSEKSIWFLCCTDMFSRGLDFNEVNTVLSWDFPQSSDSYLHRIGRTGRAGKAGKSVTFFTKQDGKYLKLVINVMKNSGCQVPDWMLGLNNLGQNDRKRLKTRPIERTSVKQAALGIGNDVRKKKKYEQNMMSQGEKEVVVDRGALEEEEEEWVPFSSTK